MYSFLKKYKIVSFDIFDTLILRSVPNPTFVFDLVRIYLKESYGIDIPRFKDSRIDSERVARMEIDQEEISLDEIYKRFAVDTSYNGDIKILKEAEIDIEKRVCYANPKLKPIYDYCIKNAIPVILTSDMYLPRSVIECILHSNGYVGYSKIYLSSDCYKTKSKGSLYDLILENEKVRPNQIIHIGDNFKSDFLIPQFKGIHSMLVRRKSYKGTKGYQFISSFLHCRNRYEKKEYYKYLGYTCFGPLLYGYCLWLSGNLKKNNIKKVFFLSRDGFIIKRAFDIIAGKSSFDEHYLEVSRRSLRVPLLWKDSNLKTLINLINPSLQFTLSYFFDGIGLNIDSYSGLIEEFNYSRQTVLNRNSVLKDVKFNSFFSRLIPSIETNSKKEYIDLCNYLKQEGVSSKFAIVDIGWTGGMQHSLSLILDSIKVEHEIIGFYTGVSEKYNRFDKEGYKPNVNGYLFDFSKDPDCIDVCTPFVGLYEFLFLERSGSVKKYYRKGNYTYAERFPYEYMLKDGSLMEECKIASQIQEAALDFIRDATAFNLFQLFPITPEDYFHNLKTIGLTPTRKDIIELGDIKFFDGDSPIPLIKSKSLLYYLFHVRTLKYDLILSHWRIGFLKNVFRLKLPYFSIFKVLKRIANNKSN